MQNKLEFLTDTLGYKWQKFEIERYQLYKWNKYNVNGMFTWDRYDIYNEYTYKWSKHQVAQKPVYNWGKYEAVPVTAYKWHKYDNVDAEDLENQYLTFQSEKSFTLAPVSYYNYPSQSHKHWNGTIEYSTDTVNWTEWDGTEITSQYNSSKEKYVIYVRGSGNTRFNISNSDQSATGWHISTEVDCVGNIETLLDYTSVGLGIHPPMGEGCFQKFFSGSYLRTPPSLPATSLSKYCYQDMFFGCYNLTTAPALPATELANSCYSGMFMGCSGLTTAPTLPATTLAYYCYQSMFANCTGLTIAPELPATTLKLGCYNNMFYRCTSLTTAPALPATTLEYNCYYQMFAGCTSLNTAPALSATIIALQSCYGMFADCTSLTIAPALPATHLSQNCYESMFAGCTSLTTAPALPATALTARCYYMMFYGCTNLTTLPEFPTIIGSNDKAMDYMFYECEKIKLSIYSSSTYNKTFRINTADGVTIDTSTMFDRTGGDITTQFITNSTFYTVNDITPITSNQSNSIIPKTKAVKSIAASSPAETVPYTEVVSTNINAYPHGGWLENSYYAYVGAYTEDYSKGEYIEDVNDFSSDTYPQDDYQDGYWYTAKATSYIPTKGDFIEYVLSNDQEAYPTDDIYNDNWYVYVGIDSTRAVKGDFVEQVTAISGTYPTDGTSGDYWYVVVGPTGDYTKGSYIEEVTSRERDSYPNDDIQGGYWYTYTSTSSVDTKSTYLEDIWDQSSSTYPTNGIYGNYWYVSQGQGYIPLYTLTDSDLKGSVSYQAESNSQDDYLPGDVNAAEIKFTLNAAAGDSVRYDQLECGYYKRYSYDEPWTLVGYFTIENLNDKTASSSDLSGYDRIRKFDTVIDQYLFTRSYPVTVRQLFIDIVTNYNLQYRVNDQLANLSYSLTDKWTGTNITGRQALAYIAELTGGYIYADKDGYICLDTYKQTNIELDSTKYVSCEQALYQTPHITKVTVQATQDDIGGSYGIDGTELRVTGNPLAYEETTSALVQLAENIYDVVSQVTYTPCSIVTLRDLDIRPGQIITVDSKTAYVMSVQWDGSTVTIVSKGNRSRQVNELLNGDTRALRGKTNELTRTIEATNSRLTDAQQGLESQITQTASTINSRITQEVSDINDDLEETKTTLQSQITQTASSITSTVEQYTDDQVAAAKTEIKQTTDSISSTVQQQGQTITSIQQGLNGIQLTYNSTNGTASLTIGDVTVSTLTDSGYVDRQVAGIDLTGYVTFHALETSGETTINGSNITTGTISANRLNLSGAIAWSDLSQSCQNTVASYAGSDANVPDYIHWTYIDSTDIYSPNIYGGKITAGTTADGYIQMSAGGMNFISSSAGNLIGMGYYSDDYNYPFITFGQGVDATGTDKGMVKKFSDGIWIGDSDSLTEAEARPTIGTGIFVQFSTNKVYKVINGTYTEL